MIQTRKHLSYSTAPLPNQFSALTKLQLLFTPGTRGQYSDPGYFLVGMVIEKASGAVKSVVHDQRRRAKKTGTTDKQAV